MMNTTAFAGNVRPMAVAERIAHEEGIQHVYLGNV